MGKVYQPMYTVQIKHPYCLISFQIKLQVTRLLWVEPLTRTSN